MAIFDELNIRVPGAGRGSPTGRRADAEAYAASLGFSPGGPGWGAAIRAYFLEGGAATSRNAAALDAAADAGSPGFAASGLTAVQPIGLRGPVSASGYQGSPSGAPSAQDSAGGSMFRTPPGQVRLNHHSVGDEPASDPAIGMPGRLDNREGEGLAMAAAGFGREVGTPPTSPPRRPGPQPTRPARATYPGGQLSEREESGGAGPGMISTGRDDPGGVSYGTHQLSANAGTLQRFVDSPEGRRWARTFSGARGGTDEFSRRWRTVAAQDADAFRQAQHDFIGRTHYAPAIASVRERTNADLDAMAPAVREAAWSVAVQHGGAARILRDAVNAADRRMRGPGDRVDRTTREYQRALLDSVYDARTDYVRALIPNASPGDQRTFRNLITNRYPRERRNALRMFDAEETER